MDKRQVFILDARDVALSVLMDVECHSTFSNQAIGTALKKNQFSDKGERAFLTRLCEGTIEYRIRLDYVINQFSKTKIKKCKPLIACLLRMGCYQILFMDSVPDSAACNECVKLAKKHGFAGLAGFVNGVLRAIARGKDNITYPSIDEEPVLARSILYSTPDWLVEKLLLDYGDKTDAILAASFVERMTSIRLNPACMQMDEESVDSFLGKLEDKGIRVKKGCYDSDAYLIAGYDFVHKIPGYRQGYFTVQDESSMAAVRAAGICPGDFVMDVCAAPGGKTTAASYYAGESGRVLSMDIAEEKLELISENVTRLRQENVSIRCHDASVFEEQYERAADVVIADVLCSGLGILGRKNDIKYRVTKQQIEDLIQIQKQILSVVCRYVKPGGTLLYSTCTINPDENDKQISHFLESHPEFTLKEQRQFLQGVDTCDGFYYAVLKRQDGLLWI